MRKIIFIFLFISLVFSKEQILLELKPGEEFYQNLNPKSCNSSCLFELLESKMYLSFLAEFIEQNDQFLSNVYAKLLNSITDFESKFQKITSVKLAIIIPENTIKSYSSTIINSSIAYLLRQRAEIKVKVFLIGTEENAKIQSTLEQIKAQGYQYAIAGFTLNGVNALKNYSDSLKIFIPTIHKNNTQISNPNIIFGSIDYEAQIKTLLSKTKGNIAIFSDNQALSNNLNSIILKETEARIYKLDGEKLDFARLLKSQGSLDEAAIFFNTSLIKTALSSSQLRIYDINPALLLSTQINYNQAFLNLTQENDRKNFIIANSINNKDESLSYINEIFNQNINYNWVAYATSIGVDYFYTNFLNKESQSLFDENLNEFQVDYKVRLMKATQGSFEDLE